MTWADRVNKSIDFTSPDGDEFIALWAGGTRSVEKKIGVFDYPKVKGASVQDMGLKAVTYPLTFYFEGAEHDTEAERFFQACSQRGPWQVDHPTKGRKSLQLISISEEIQPITSGNITQISSEWIETNDKTKTKSTAQLAAEIEDQAEVVNEVAAAQFDKVKTGSFSKLAALKKSIQTIVGKVKESVDGLKRLVADVNAQVDAIQRGIQETLDAVIFEPLKLAAQVQQLIQLPALVMNDFSARFDTYKAFAEDLFGIGSDEPSDEFFNTAKSKELALSSVVSAVAVISSTSSFQTRAQAIEAIEAVTALFNAITENLDADQTLFDQEKIDRQFFSQSESYIDAARVISMIQGLIIRQSFDLAVEKRITLDRPRTPVEIAVTEYKGFGENDSNIDLFVQSNALSGSEILILPAGREVVIYV